MIDRDALFPIVKELLDGGEYDSGPAIVWPEVDRILALEKPGVTLTPEEAERAAGWYFQQAEDIIPDAADRALVARLEAASR